MTHQKILISLISTALHNCREVVDSADLQESIKQDGVVVPVGVNLTDDGQYQLIYGFRRFSAAKAVGLAEIPVTVHRNLSAADALTLNLQENVARKSLTPMEEAQAIKRIMDASAQDPSEGLSRSLGWSKTLITQRLALLQMPAEVQDALKRDSISVGQARAISTAPSEIIGDLIKTAEDGATVAALRSQMEDAADLQRYKDQPDDYTPSSHDVEPVSDSDVKDKPAADARWLKDHLLLLGEYLFEDKERMAFSLAVDRVNGKRIPPADLEALCDVVEYMVRRYESLVAEHGDGE